jgi:hypothetical protein
MNRVFNVKLEVIFVGVFACGNLLIAAEIILE